MSGGLLVYMETLTDPVAGGTSVFSLHVTATGHGRYAAFTTRDSNVSLLPLNASSGSTVSYLHGLICDEITANQSADISKGKGFHAPAIDGEISIADGDGKVAQDIAAGKFRPIGWDVYIGEYDLTNPTYPRALVHLQIVDYSIEGGVFRAILKSPCYLYDKPLFSTKSSTQVSIDPENPESVTPSGFSQMAGVAFGNHPVSLKAGTPLPPIKIPFWRHTTIQIGDIGTIPGQIAYSAATTCVDVTLPDVTEPAFHAQTYNGDGTLKFGASVKVFCRSNSFAPTAADATEANRLVALLDQLVIYGYSIVLSDGDWFFEVTSPANRWDGSLAVSTAGRSAIATGGAPYGMASWTSLTSGRQNTSFVWFNVNAKDGSAPYPKDGLSGDRISIFAVPATVAISAGQYDIEGFASNARTLPVIGEVAYSNGVLTLRPAMVSESSFVAISALKSPKIAMQTPGSVDGFLGSAGFVQTNVNPVTGSGSGDISDIVTDPTVGWDGVTVPIDFGLDPLAYALDYNDFAYLIDCKVGKIDSDADFYCVESTWNAWYRHTKEWDGWYKLFVSAPFEDPDQQVETHYFSGAAGGGITTTRSHTADKNRNSVLWQSRVRSLDEFGKATPKVRVRFDPDTGGPANVTQMRLQIMECFIWAFTKFAFSDVYSTAYPFWTRYEVGKIAYHDGMVGCHLGRGVIRDGGEIEWTLTPKVATFNGICELDFLGLSGFVAVDSENSWVLMDSDSEWIRSDDYFTISKPAGSTFTNLRAFGSTLLSTTTKGVGTFDLGVTIRDVAFDGTNYIAVGPSGRVYKSTSPFSLWTNVTAAGITGNLYGIAWNGTIFVAVGAGGKAYYATSANAVAGNWTAVVVDATGGTISAVAANGIQFVIVFDDSSGGHIVESTDGATWSTAFSDADTVFGSPRSIIWTGSYWYAATGRGQMFSRASAVTSQWIPWGTGSINKAVQNIAARFTPDLRTAWNPIKWSGGKYLPNLQTFGVAFDPPSSGSATTASEAIRKISREWWAFSGEMPQTSLDGSSDVIEKALPEVNLGNIEDQATLITANYQPFAGDYLSTAYIQNVNVAYAPGNDAFYFDGWDDSGNTNGLALWNACRSAYLETGCLRPASFDFDSIHDAGTLGELMVGSDPDLGDRIDWICKRPQYLKLKVYGNDSAAAKAYCGCRYKPNYFMLTTRGIASLSATGYGVVVSCSHNFVTGEHDLEIAFPPN